MPRKTTDKHTAAYIPYRCSQTTYEAIEKISVAQKKTRVQVVRDLVEAGLVATGYTELDRLAGVAGVTVTSREITGTVYGTKIQFGSEFTVHLTTTDNIGVGGMLSVPVQLETRVTGRSERYWK